jgi:DisA bacterial checkpoint controller nucleotide-binding
MLGHPESLVFAPRHQSQSPRNHQRIGATGRWVRRESRWSRPFRVPLPRRRGRTSGCAARTRQSSLGSRHIAAANIGAVTKAVGIVVSESSVVRLFCHGQLVAEIIPELGMMDHAPHLRGTVKREQVGELTVLTPSPRRAPVTK